ncbi:MAG: hypothetical protein JW951_05065 [Lentisphaerae bacterium]|nr:hypothetical protein [Lentisphaerota bacterium]
MLQKRQKAVIALAAGGLAALCWGVGPGRPEPLALPAGPPRPAAEALSGPPGYRLAHRWAGAPAVGAVPAADAPPAADLSAFEPRRGAGGFLSPPPPASLVLAVPRGAGAESGGQDAAALHARGWLGEAVRDTAPATADAAAGLRERRRLWQAWDLGAAGEREPFTPESLLEEAIPEARLWGLGDGE